MNRKLALRLATIPAFLAATGGYALAAGAAAIDVTDTTSGITNQVASILTVGGAILGVFVVLKALHWVRRALS